MILSFMAETLRNMIRTYSVLQRLSEKQLTLNAEKCTFRMSKVVFMGLLLSKHGVGPTKEKVRAVAEASQPHTQKFAAS